MNDLHSKNGRKGPLGDVMWTRFDLNNLIVQGYRDGEFDEGYFSDGLSDDYLLSFSDLPKSVQETWNKSLN